MDCSDVDLADCSLAKTSPGAQSQSASLYIYQIGLRDRVSIAFVCYKSYFGIFGCGFVVYNSLWMESRQSLTISIAIYVYCAPLAGEKMQA
jgi:hypothetical protein